LNGAQEVHVSGKYAYVIAYQEDGLAVLELAGLGFPAADIGALATGNLHVTDNANIHNNLYVDGALNIGPGGLYVDAGNGITTDGDFIVLGDISIAGSSLTSGIQISGTTGVTVDPERPNVVNVLIDDETTFFNQTYSVDVQGDYAYLATFGWTSERGLAIMDVSDPANPKYLSFVGSCFTGNGARDVKVVGDYAYVVARPSCGSDYGLVIFDVSDKSSPTPVGTIFDNSTIPLKEAHEVYVSGGYAYVTSNIDDGLAIINVSDVTNPTYVGGVTNSSSPLNRASSIYVQGDYAYIGGTDNGGPMGLSIVDISDPTNPVEVGSLEDNASLKLRYPHGLYVSGSYAYVAGTEGFNVVDISDPANPFVVGDVTLGSFMFHVVVAGDYAYVSGSYGLRQVDISDPQNPILVSSVLYTEEPSITPPGTTLQRNMAVHGKYVYLFSKNNLSVIELPGVDSPTADIGSLSVSIIDVAENAQIANDMYVSGGMMVGESGMNVQGGIYGITRTGGSIDVAEWIKTIDALEPGDVVVADTRNDGKVRLSTKPYDSTVVGVISTKPHLTMGNEFKGTDAARLALTGRVPVKATTENGPISSGDLLTTSSTPGYAMRWSFIDPMQSSNFDELKSILEENNIRRKSVLGKALESLESEEGKIMVLVNLQ